MQQERRRGGFWFKQHTILHLSPASVEKLILRKLNQNHTHLSGRFRQIDEWPAAAQFAVHSLAWACGPAFRFPALTAYLKSQNWKAAIGEIHINEYGPDRIKGTNDDNPGVKPRNDANKLLLQEASDVVRLGLDRDKLWYPKRPAVTVEPDILIIHDINSYFPERNP